MATVLSHLAPSIRTQLYAAANPADAPAMAAYMRHIQPFLGVRTPERREVVRVVLKAHSNRTERFAAAAELWQGKYPEERCAALDILVASKSILADLPMPSAFSPQRSSP